MIKKPNGCDYYLLLWCLYQLKGILYPIGVINGLVHYAMLIWGLLITVGYVFSFRRQHPFIKATLVIMLMYIVYGVIYMFYGKTYYTHNGNPILKTTYLLASIDSLFPIFVFHHFSKKGYLGDKKITSYFGVLLAVLLVDLLFSYRSMSVGLLDADATNNKTYSFLSIFPLLFFIDNIRRRYIYASLIILILFLGVKRGAIVIGILSLLYFIYQDTRWGSRRKRIISILLSTILLLGAAGLFLYLATASTYFSSRLQATLEGNSSGRDMIFDNIWYGAIKNASWKELVFGYGASSTVYFAGNYAHNDWLETICNNGLLGVVLLLAFFVQNLRLALSFKRRDKKYYLSGMLLFYIAFAKTLFSMSIQSLGITQCMLLGYFCYQAQYWNPPVNDSQIESQIES